MAATVVDVETTIFQKGNPFARRNRLCYVGAYASGSPIYAAAATELSDFQRAIDGATLLVGFNFKFDLHWLRRAGIKVENKRIWDCQFAHFLLSAQRDPRLSLEKVSVSYGISGLGDLSEKYWNRGIDTPDIPVEEVLEYLRGDLLVTMEVYERQRRAIETDTRLLNLFRLHMDDLLVLQEMEWNGLKYNVEESDKQREIAESRLRDIETELRSRYPNTPINWDSGDHVSAYLFGGSITVERQVPIGVYKTGVRAGQIKLQWQDDVHMLPRLVSPIEGSELAKADKEKGTGPWSVAEDVLKQVKQIREVKLLLERAKLTKLLDYLKGFPSLMVEKDWPEGEIHGQFNQCIARTGRLSSSAPNLQNLPDPVLKLIETRYDI
jgi:DNA polymerase I-like protein with 3'-5' exonuclease and polymerase domains